jgi:hypothetical protein
MEGCGLVGLAQTKVTRQDELKVYCKGQNWIQVRQDTFLRRFFFVNVIVLELRS